MRKLFKMLAQGMKKILEGVLKYQSTLKGELVPMFREILDHPAPKSLSNSNKQNRLI